MLLIWHGKLCHSHQLALASPPSPCKSALACHNHLCVTGYDNMCMTRLRSQCHVPVSDQESESKQVCSTAHSMHRYPSSTAKEASSNVVNGMYASFKCIVCKIKPHTKSMSKDACVLPLGSAAVQMGTHACLATPCTLLHKVHVQLHVHT